MTWDQIELFANAAAERTKQDILLNANTAALGMAVGFSGDDKPLKNLARQMEVAVDLSTTTREDDRMTRAIGDIAKLGNVRITSHGPDRRRAVGRAGSKDARVPRGPLRSGA